MPKFIDGPAAGVVLDLKRVPFLLRVTRLMRHGKVQWDALDLIEDFPLAGEEIFVYFRTGEVHQARICGRPRLHSGLYLFADYMYLPEQPGDLHTRTNSAWTCWAEPNASRLLLELTITFKQKHAACGEIKSDRLGEGEDNLIRMRCRCGDVEIGIATGPEGAKQ